MRADTLVLLLLVGDQTVAGTQLRRASAVFRGGRRLSADVTNMAPFVYPLTPCIWVPHCLTNLLIKTLRITNLDTNIGPHRLINLWVKFNLC